ncbi:MAG: hypothetical protein R3314_00585 [Longimicrobiales bacterium]|nr:hypothetical protein [Longimicrobiales bacterium]
MARVEAGRATVFFSVHDDQGGARGEAAARRMAEPLGAAADFFAERLDGDFHFNFALLSPRDWGRTGGPPYPLPWHSQPDRLVVVPVRPDISPMVGGPDRARARRTLDVMSVHQLGHIVTAAYFHPADFRAPEPPVRWFDELLASYLAYTYLQEHDPELAEFMEDYAREVTLGTEPRFSSLAHYDAFRETYLSSTQGATDLSWYHNAFNLRAAQLYRRHGSDLMHRFRSELPWSRIESWTTDELLGLLDELSPGFLAWAEEMAEVTRRRY